MSMTAADTTPYPFKAGGGLYNFCRTIGADFDNTRRLAREYYRSGIYEGQQEIALEGNNVCIVFEGYGATVRARGGFDFVAKRHGNGAFWEKIGRFEFFDHADRRAHGWKFVRVAS